MMHSEPFRPTPDFALELEAKGYPRAAIVLTLPASAIPASWRLSRSDLDEHRLDDDPTARAKIQAAKDALSALNVRGES